MDKESTEKEEPVEMREMRSVVDALRKRCDRLEAERDAVSELAQDVIRSKTEQLERIAEQGRLWKRGDLEMMAFLSGVFAELHGYPLPEPGTWERARAVKLAEKESVSNQMAAEMDLVREELAVAGVRVHSSLHTAVSVLAKQRDEALVQNARIQGMVERGLDAHMQFGVIGADGETEMQPCADWCSACKMDDVKKQLDNINDKLKAAGIEHPLGVQGVRDLVAQRDGAYEALDEWKAYEAAARGAAMQLLEIFGYGGTALSARLQAGNYGDVIDVLKRSEAIR